MHLPPMFTPCIFSTFNFENFTKYLQGPLRVIFNQGLNCSCSWIFNKDFHHLSDQHLKWMQLNYIDLWRFTSLFNSLLYLFPSFFGGFVFENNFAYVIFILIRGMQLLILVNLREFNNMEHCFGDLLFQSLINFIIGLIILWIITKSYHVIITLVTILYDNYLDITSDGPSSVHSVRANLTIEGYFLTHNVMGKKQI